MTENPAPGWYADPQGTPPQQRWWDGTRWTEHTQGQAQQQPAQAQPVIAGSTSTTTNSDAKTWAMAAHLSALPAAFIGLAFLGPLVVYLIKKDDHPFIRQQAGEALNFQLSFLLYTVVFGIVFLILLLLIVGVVLIPVAIAGAIAWLVLTIMGGVKANQGEAFKYPLTIRLVN
jgi:uncharacterized Tic20 family protein